MSVIDQLESGAIIQWQRGGRPYEFRATMNSTMMDALDQELGKFDFDTDAPWDRKALRLDAGLYHFVVDDQYPDGNILVEVTKRGDDTTR